MQLPFEPGDQDAFTQALFELRAAEKQYGDLGMSIYHIRHRGDHTLSQVTHDIPYVARYLTLADTVNALAVKVRRLDGYSKTTASYREADMSIYGLSRDVVVENLRTKLEGIRSKSTPATTQQRRSEEEDFG